MNRRQLLTALVALPGPALAACASLPAPGASPSGVSFETARRRNPMLAGFDNAPGDLDIAAVVMEGKLPDGLSGKFYRNGPGQHALGGERYQHWFDGDGYIQSWTLGGGKAAFRGRFVDTPKRRAEQKAGQFLYPAGGGGIPARAGLSGSDSVNVANTNILRVGDDLWALWEGGSATRLDPETLAASGLVAFNDDLAGVPFSAHPRRGEDGRIWNIGTMLDSIVLYRLTAGGALDAFKLHRIAPVGLIHDFLITHKSIIVVLASTRMDGNIQDGFFTAIKGRADLPMQVKIYDRESLELVREAELLAGYVFHFGNAHEDAAGTIIFDMVWSKDTENLQQMRLPMRGELPKNDSLSQRVTLPVKGAPVLADLRAGVEFPRINERLTAQRHRYLYMAAEAVPGKSRWFDSICKFDLETGRYNFALYGADWMVEEHVFVPKPGASQEDDGWLIGAALNWQKQQTALSVFDARRPDTGPLARFWLLSALPLGFHGQFAPRV